MAVWQFQIKFIPRDIALAQGLAHGEQLSHAQRDEVLWWRGQIVPGDALEKLRETLPLGSTWTEDLAVFGDLEGTCVTILRHDDDIVDVNARLDLRSLTEEAAGAVLDFARRVKCLLVTDMDRVLNPEPVSLFNEIKASPAYRFVKSPHGFLAALENRKQQ